MAEEHDEQNNEQHEQEGNTSGTGSEGNEGNSGTEQPPDYQQEAEKWKQLARKHEQQSKANADKAKKYDEWEEQNKSEQQKTSEELDRLKSENSSLSASQNRLDVALDNAPEGMSVAQIRKLSKRLSGESREELEADAKELFSEFAPSNDESNSESRRPKERLRPGASKKAEPEKSPDELAEAVLKNSRGF